jgi:hypothetical protein
MVFEFGKYTEVTDFVFKTRPEYKNEGYVRFFICPDTWDFWFVRVLEDVNEEYEKEEGAFLIERNKIEKEHKGEKLSIVKLKEIIEEDDMSNWDVLECTSIEEVIDNLSDVFGINNLKESQ